MGVHLYTNGAWTDSGRIYRNSLNLFDKNDVTQNVRLDAEGNFIESTNCNTSDYIDVQSSTAITQAYSFSFENCIAEYDENYNFVTRYVSGNGNFITSATTKYIRMTIQKARTDTAMLYYGNVVIPYEPYNVVDWYTNYGHGYTSGAWS